MKEDIQHFIKKFKNEPIEVLLAHFLKLYDDRIMLASSLGVEDQVLTDMVLKINPKARIFVLDTGRLHQETYEVMSETRVQYNMNYEVFFPEAKAVENMLNAHGPNLMYESYDNRRLCCTIRKVEPLARALKTCDAWITGLRREQSPARSNHEIIEYDSVHDNVKLNPLIEWTTDQIWEYIKTHDVPYNTLHDNGYPSIGCVPCTRAINRGDDLRAGRWWWEKETQKECGIHFEDGKMVKDTPKDDGLIGGE
ncbi:MAG: phosphoadenylyl-sulfate reductase [Candidatus Margulisbacteria bacterium]|nr:phosphoadenylyl-sulfate reductase [Candidatus Margulisiibacteriota bacterium]